MQESTVRLLIIARTLIDRASSLCSADDRYQATAGLIILQDGLEIALLASLLEKNPNHKLDKVTDFEKLLGDLGASGVDVPKSGTLKLLNKTRVLSKHYGNLAEPTQVRDYFKAATAAIDGVLEQVGGTGLRGIFLASMLEDGEAKELLGQAEGAIGNGDFFGALVLARKAFFIEFEVDYSVHGWRNGAPLGLVGASQAGGWSAPSHTRNPEWIAMHVNVPTDYVQVDSDNLRLRSMELGLSYPSVQQIRTRTPAVFRASRDVEWSISYPHSAPANATEGDARFCVDLVITAVLRKQTYMRAHPVLQRQPQEQVFLPAGTPIYRTATTAQDPIGHARDDAVYVCLKVVGGFEPGRTFWQILGAWREQALADQPTRNRSISGFVERP